MNEKEGELKKRIFNRELCKGCANENGWCGTPCVGCVNRIVIENGFKILDEAKKELDAQLKTILKNAEQLDVNNHQEQTLKTLLILQSMLNVYKDFVKKWFGSE